MPRLGRYFVPDQPLHLIQRGNNREPVFFDAEDYARYLGWLGEAAAEYGVGIHAYVLMTNHVHLLATPAATDALPGMMQSLGRRYVQHVNRTYQRTGTLWEGRYRAAPIQAEAHFLATMRYIELNPVRARMVRKPGNYAWSSHRANAGLEPDDARATDAPSLALSEHALYRSLGRDRAERALSYRALFAERLPEEFIDDLRAATNGGWALGSARWKAKVERVAKRRATPRPAGRPRKDADGGKREGQRR